jgi:hypothetical protein
MMPSRVTFRLVKPVVARSKDTSAVTTIPSGSVVQVLNPAVGDAIEVQCMARSGIARYVNLQADSFWPSRVSMKTVRQPFVSEARLRSQPGILVKTF